MHHPFIRLRPRSRQIHVSQGRIVWVSDDTGVIDGGVTGLFVHQTRMLSRHRVFIDGQPLEPVALSKVRQHAWLGYYVRPAPWGDEVPTDVIVNEHEALSEETLELRVSRFVEANVHEDFDLTNFSRAPTRFEFAIELDADFADQAETVGPREQFGELERTWRELDGGRWALGFSYRAEHEGRRLERGLNVQVHRFDSPPRLQDGRLCFEVALEPQERWHCCLDYIPELEPALTRERAAASFTDLPCHTFGDVQTPMDARREAERKAVPSLHVSVGNTMPHVVTAAYTQAIEDLISLRLPDLDTGPQGWTIAAGLPLYVALFGRDTLTAAWQSAMLGTGLLRGTLTTLARFQGTRVDDWRDEQPGRMLHEAHTGPLEVLDYNPRGRYYGSITTSAFYPVALAELWHWTGDRDAVAPLVRPALEALAWLDREALGDRHGGVPGFYAYETRSPQGIRNQAWKDSSLAMVYEDGTVADPPLATCEEQGFVYMAKAVMGELLWWLGARDTARRLAKEAAELKRRFLDAFWMPEQGYLAMAIDRAGRPLRSIASNAGHCMATGIIDRAMAGPIAGRLISPDLFSGWGVRTLSSEHPAYNPYSYHRGSVWPVENGTFALGMLRFGLHEHAAHLSRAQFEAAALFDSFRLPEVFSGHARDADHPFPAFYPRSNSPQAWSSSAIFCFVQAMCGFYPYAPLKMLLLDPHLPEWLPELTIENLEVGDARATIEFRRERDGKTSYRVHRLEGTLHVLRQPSPWSLTAGPGERVADALSSLLPRH